MEISKEMKMKNEFVNNISAALAAAGKELRYEFVLFREKTHDDWEQEYVIATYKSGEVAARNNNGNSILGTLEAVVDLLYGAHTEQETQFYKNMLQNPNWEKVNFEKEDN